MGSWGASRMEGASRLGWEKGTVGRGWGSWLCYGKLKVPGGLFGNAQVKGFTKRPICYAIGPLKDVCYWPFKGSVC